MDKNQVRGGVKGMPVSVWSVDVLVTFKKSKVPLKSQSSIFELPVYTLPGKRKNSGLQIPEFKLLLKSALV